MPEVGVESSSELLEIAVVQWPRRTKHPQSYPDCGGGPRSSALPGVYLHCKYLVVQCNSWTASSNTLVPPFAGTS